MADKFCKFCGEAHTAPEYPQQCPSCSTMTWFSPSPVAALLQPVWKMVGEKTVVGVAIGTRGIEPMKGQWNLFAGFVDPADPCAATAAAREFNEETGGGLSADPLTIKIDHTFCDGRHLLIFCHSPIAIHVDDLARFVPNEECPEIDVAWEPRQLCFDSHTRALAKWFKDDPDVLLPMS